MRRTAKLFRNGRSQAVRLPVEFRLPGKEVFVRRNPATGEVILSPKPDTWAGFFKMRQAAEVPEEFMAERRDETPQDRELF